MNRRLRFLALFFLGWLFVAPNCEGGCSCGPCANVEENGSAIDDSVAPEDRAELARTYAQRFPAGTNAIVIARGFEDLSRSFQTLKVRIHDLFDLGVIESEIRNTFGVELDRAVTFREVGIDYQGGFAVATVMQQPVVAFYLVDQEAFVARAQLVLRRQPFNLRAPVDTEQIGQATVHLFKSRANENDPVEFAVMVNGDFGFIIGRTNTTNDLFDVATLLAETTPAESMASNPEFDVQAARFDAYPGFLFIDTTSATSFYQDQYSDQFNDTENYVLNEVQRAILSIGVGIRFGGDELDVEAYVSVVPEEAELAAGIDQPQGESPHLERLLEEIPFLTIRLAADTGILWETVLRFHSDADAEALRELLGPFEELLISGEGGVLSGHALLTFDRLAVMSLANAESLVDQLDALDFSGMFHLANRERAFELLDAMVARNPENYFRSQSDGITRYTGGSNGSEMGHIIVREDLVFWTGERMRRHAMGDLPEGTGVAAIDMVHSARALLQDASATGLILTFERLIPIAIILNYPEPVREALNLLDTLTVRAEVDGNGLVLVGNLTLEEPE